MSASPWRNHAHTAIHYYIYVCFFFIISHDIFVVLNNNKIDSLWKDEPSFNQKSFEKIFGANGKTELFENLFLFHISFMWRTYIFFCICSTPLHRSPVLINMASAQFLPTSSKCTPVLNSLSLFFILYWVTRRLKLVPSLMILKFETPSSGSKIQGKPGNIVFSSWNA